MPTSPATAYVTISQPWLVSQHGDFDRMVLLDVRHERATRLRRAAPLLLRPRDMPRLRLMASAT